jgi:hypothetical protein
MQTVDIRSRFEATGVVRLQGAFAAEQAAAMREAVWRHAERLAGLRPGDPASWAGSPVLNWQGLKRNPAFRPLVDNQLVSDALDVIFGAGGWQRPRFGAQILFSLPEPGPWVLPDAWHMDCGFEQATFMRRHPWLARLLDGANLPDHGRPLVGAEVEIDGVPVQVVELTGSPGDVVVTHLHVFHARSPNTDTVPRLMLGKEIRRVGDT